jgi:ribosomal protein S18 acetylase RimI-like enzyme
MIINENEIKTSTISLIKNKKMRSTLNRNSMIAVDGNGLVRVANILKIVQQKEWDTKFFGVKIAQVTCKSLTKSIIKYIDTTCQNNKIDCLYYLCDESDSLSIYLAKKHYVNHVDTRVTLSYNLDKFQKSKQLSTVNIRHHIKNDISLLKKIAGSIYNISRFYSDNNFSNELCNQFYETWIENACRGYADKVFIAEINNKIIGFITCNLDEKTKTGKIGLIGVEPHSQGKQVGIKLVEKALYWFEENDMKNVEVSTQKENILALRLYKKCGFTILKKELWFHKWFKE